MRRTLSSGTVIVQSGPMAAALFVAQLLAGQGMYTLLAGPQGVGKSLALQALGNDVPADKGVAMLSCSAGTRPHQMQLALNQHLETSTKV